MRSFNRNAILAATWAILLISPRTASATGGGAEAWLKKAEKAIRAGIRAGAYPGAALIVRRNGATLAEEGFGRMGWGPGTRTVSPDSTWYDLASLTKVLGTTTALMVLVDKGEVGLDEPAATWIPAWRVGPKSRITIRHLLAHRSGLPAARDIWRIPGTMEIRREAVLNTPLAHTPGARYVYSDIGADILGFIIERATGVTLETAIDSLVLAPAGLSSQLAFRMNPHTLAMVAPTENRPPRGYPIQGEVHDENAYALGGVAGHAGMFGTARGVANLAEIWLNGGIRNEGRLVQAATVREFTAHQGDGRALGWQKCLRTNGARPTCGTSMSDRAYGHTGYTGTSLWIDPDDSTVVVFLTNRVHSPTATRSQKILADIRADLSDLSSASWRPDNGIALRSTAKSGWVPARRAGKKYRNAKARSSVKSKNSAKKAPKKSARNTKSAR